MVDRRFFVDLSSTSTLFCLFAVVLLNDENNWAALASTTSHKKRTKKSPFCSVIPTRFRTNNLIHPLALPDARPRFSWALRNNNNIDSDNYDDDGHFQSAYRIVVTDEDDCSILWDTGKITSGETLQIEYDGKPLQFLQRCSWKVFVWDQNGNYCHDNNKNNTRTKKEQDPTSYFETGLLYEEAWGGSEWITRYSDPPLVGNASYCELSEEKEENKAPRFRTEFEFDPSSFESIRAYVVGLGYYRLFVNGKRVGAGGKQKETVLDPGWTTYSKRVLYAVHDITDHFLHHHDPNTTTTRHAVGVELGNGWWNPLPLLFWGRIDARHALVTQQGHPSSRPMFRIHIVGFQDTTTKFLDPGQTSTSDNQKRIMPVSLLISTTRSTSSSGSSGYHWKASGSPTIFNNVYLGEKYDATLESQFVGWNQIHFDEQITHTGGWKMPERADTSGLGPLEAQAIPPIRIQRVYKTRRLPSNNAKKRKKNSNSTRGEDDDRIFILDTGTNHAGTCRVFVDVTSSNVVAGSILRLRYGELLYPNGELNIMTSVAGQVKTHKNEENTNNDRDDLPSPSPCQPDTAYQEDILVLDRRTTSSSIDWTPSYSWHGFRYIEVTLPPSGLRPEDVQVECYTIRSDLPEVSTFQSSDPWLSTKLHELNKNTYDSNLMSVQSDCPHRERFGYGGDMLGCGEAGLTMYDFSTFYRKIILDYNDAQRLDRQSSTSTKPGTATTLPTPIHTFSGFTETAPFVGISDRGLDDDPESAEDSLSETGPIGWEAFQPEAQLWLYKYYGDTRTMRDSYQHTADYIALLDRAHPGTIENGLGDWMAVHPTITNFTGLAFQRMSYLAYANITEILGMPNNITQHYRKKAAALGNIINSRFLDQETCIYRVGTDKNNRTREITQTGQGLALFTGLVPNSQDTRALCLQQLANYTIYDTSFMKGACKAINTTCPADYSGGGPGPHLTAGLFGIKWFLMSLADGGWNDLAYDVVTQKSFPSIGWMTNNAFENATTLWESFFFSDDVYSHNHPMFSSTEVWLLQSVAGIQPHPSARGMDRVIIRPNPPSQLQNAAASFETPRGVISVSWKKKKETNTTLSKLFFTETHAIGNITSTKTKLFKFFLSATIPPNCRATVHVPAIKDGLVLHRIGANDKRNTKKVRGGRWVPVESNTGALPGQKLSGSLVVQIGNGHHVFYSHVLATDRRDYYATSLY